MQQLKVGLIGCGEVTQIMHLPSLAQLQEEFTVTALCDVSNHVLETIGEQWQVKNRFIDYQELLEQADVDVVLIANPNAFHAEVALAAIAAGKHVLVEKPMCMTLREADEIIAAQKWAGVTVQVGYMRRYAPAFVEARRRIPELGEIRLARVHDILGTNSLFVKQTSRVVKGNDVSEAVIESGQKKQTELVEEAIGVVAPEISRAYNLMLGLSAHDISAMRELLGFPKRVLYAAQRQGGLYLSAAFDYGDYVCHYETGVDAIARFDAGLEVYSEKKVLRVQYNTPYIRNLPIRLFITETNGAGGVSEQAMLPTWGDPFVAEWQAFHENITQGRNPKTSPADFRQDLELFRDMVKLMRD